MTSWVREPFADGRLAFERPATWDARFGEPGSDIVLVAPEQSVDGFQANVAVAGQEMPEPVSLDAFTEAQLAGMPRLYADVRIIDSSGATLLGGPAARALIVYRQGAFSLAREQWWTTSAGGDVVVVVSATCAALDYDAYADAFGHMAASLVAANTGAGDA